MDFIGLAAVCRRLDEGVISHLQNRLRADMPSGSTPATPDFRDWMSQPLVASNGASSGNDKVEASHLHQRPCASTSMRFE